MHNVLIAGMGGFIGTMLRYLINSWAYDLLKYPIFPYGTLIINVSGCLLIGLLSGLTVTREIFTPELRIFIFVGILGGYTTFSSFGFETFHLFLNGHFFLATLNIMTQTLLGLVAVGLGYFLATKL